MKHYVLFLLIPFLSGCKNLLIERKYDHETVKFEMLDNEVRNVYYNALLVDMKMKMTVNLDSAYADYKYVKNTSNSLWTGYQIFLIDGKKYYLPWNGNSKTHPFVLFDQKLYMVSSPHGRRPRGEEEVKSSEYIVVDLSKKLKYER